MVLSFYSQSRRFGRRWQKDEMKTRFSKEEEEESNFSANFLVCDF